MDQGTQEKIKVESEDRKVRFAEHYAAKFSDSVIRYTQIANERLNSLSRLLFEVAGVEVVLVGAHLLQKTDISHPYSKLGLLCLLASSLMGAIQMWMDSQFFAEHARIDGELGTRFSHIYIGSDYAQKYKDEAKHWLGVKDSLPKSSNHLALYTQCLFVAMGTVLIYYELFIK